MSDNIYRLSAHEVMWWPGHVTLKVRTDVATALASDTVAQSGHQRITVELTEGLFAGRRCTGTLLAVLPTLPAHTWLELSLDLVDVDDHNGGLDARQ